MHGEEIWQPMHEDEEFSDDTTSSSSSSSRISSFSESDEEAEHPSESSSNNEQESGKCMGKQKRSFDIRIPTTHPYLNSSQLGEIAATSLYTEPGCSLTVPALVMDTVLLPGQTLPLHFTEQGCVEFLAEFSRRHQYVALLTTSHGEETAEAYIRGDLPTHEVGTLFQVQNASQSNESGGGGEGRKLTIQAVGKQRCRLGKKLTHSDVLCEEYTVALCEKVCVEVLGEEELSPFANTLDGSSLNRLSTNERRKWQYALYQLTPYAIEQCLTQSVVRWLENWLRRWFDSHRIRSVLGQGQTMFSYWVAANLPVNLDTKMELLSENSTDRRLKREWRIACGMSSLACAECEDVKCEVGDLINLNAEGNSCHFVNPSGCVHDLFTAVHLVNVEAIGVPSNDFSWFPGYAWTCLYCSLCKQHLGWKFTSQKLMPKRFYGITRKSIKAALAD